MSFSNEQVGEDNLVEELLVLLAGITHVLSLGPAVPSERIRLSGRDHINVRTSSLLAGTSVSH
eukprot:6000770-Amphidinium_carterae.1